MNLSSFSKRDFMSAQRNLRWSFWLLNSSRMSINAIKKENADLRQKILDLSCQNRLLLQLNEALGDHNRWLASEALGHPASNEEAFLHYVSNGGKTKFDQNHPLRG